jgi:hypothetical protein
MFGGKRNLAADAAEHPEGRESGLLVETTTPTLFAGTGHLVCCHSSGFN